MPLMRTAYIVLICFLASCTAQKQAPVVISGTTMGTEYFVTLLSQPEKPYGVIRSEIQALLDSINRKMSTYIDNSELSRINQSDSLGWQPVSSELFTVLETALAISEETDGAFDITIGGAVTLWGFGPGPGFQRIPDPEELADTLETAGYRHIHLRSSPYAVRKDMAATYLDLSGIAKGYAVDQVAEYLERQNIQDFLVDIGGEIRARGQNNREEFWHIGIEKPLINAREVQRVISLNNLGMATSGDYRNFFTHEGVRYSHTINPETGWPVPHTVTSVTVLDESSMVADARATALMVMGAEKGYRHAEEKGIPAFFILNDNGQFIEKYTDAFAPYLTD